MLFTYGNISGRVYFQYGKKVCVKCSKYSKYPMPEAVKLKLIIK